MTYRAYLEEHRKFGVEIEAYGKEQEEIAELLCKVGIDATTDKTYREGTAEWTVSTDGTIKQPLPLEIISPPLCGLQGIRQVIRVLYMLKQADVKTDVSCALHVHWNATNFSGIHLQNLVRLYAKFEPILDSFVDKSRRRDGNQHCRSLLKENSWQWVDELGDNSSRAYEVARKFEETQRLTPVTSFPSARHHKLNLCAVNKYGTVEFRQHHSTFDYESVKNWILLTGQMMHRAGAGDIKAGEITLKNFFKVLGVTQLQLNSFPRADDFVLAEMREFYTKKYKGEKLAYLFL